MNLAEELDVVPAQFFQKMISTQELWEVRVKTGGNLFWFLSFFDGPTLVVLANAFQKKTPKMPPQAIRTAEERKQDFFRRKRQ